MRLGGWGDASAAQLMGFGGLTEGVVSFAAKVQDCVAGCFSVGEQGGLLGQWRVGVAPVESGEGRRSAPCPPGKELSLGAMFQIESAVVAITTMSKALMEQQLLLVGCKPQLAWWHLRGQLGTRDWSSQLVGHSTAVAGRVVVRLPPCLWPTG